MHKLASFVFLQEVSQRMYGVFDCRDCDRQWSSGHAWPGIGQQCLSCMKMIQPTSLEPLRLSLEPRRSEPHKQELCGKCQMLGTNCMDEEDGQSDVESVISENSSVASDDDDHDKEQLVKQFASLKPR